MSHPSFFSPAKINLLLAVTGRRADGFHDLVSVVAPLAWGDTLTVEPDDEFSLRCNDPAVPRDASNLVLKAAAAFCLVTGWHGGARFRLEKRIPIGAGLGGGSSNAATALKALNQLAGTPLAPAALAEVAADVGSDCALFLAEGPVVMRGRGEHVEPLPAAAAAAARLSGRRVLVFKPAFGISTAWAYGRMAAAAPAGYVAEAAAEARVAGLIEAAAAGGAWEKHLFNNLEPVAFRKFPALPVLLGRLEAAFGLAPRMSGSGSACFALLEEHSPVSEIVAAIRTAWGGESFVVETGLR